MVSAQFTSFTYQNAAHTDVTASLTSQQKADVAAVEASLALTPASTNANDGSVGWSYDVADSKLDFLAAGETLTLTYTATVSEGPSNSVTEPITVTITGTNDAPTIATTSGSITELPGTGNGTIDHAAGTIAFADPDLTDRPAVSTQFTSFTYQNAADQNITSSLTPQQQADVAALEASLALTPSPTNANDGSVGWSYDVADSKLDFLAAGDVLTLTYMATVNDGHGGLASQPLTVTITGTNDQPTIVSETNPLDAERHRCRLRRTVDFGAGRQHQRDRPCNRDVRRPVGRLVVEQWRRARQFLQRRSRCYILRIGRRRRRQRLVRQHHRRAVRRTAARQRRRDQLFERRRRWHGNHHLCRTGEHLWTVLGFGRYLQYTSISTTERRW